MNPSARRTLHRHRGTARPKHAASSTRLDTTRGWASAHTARFGDYFLTYFEHGAVALDGDRAWRSDLDGLRLVVVIAGEVHLRHADTAATLGARDSALIRGLGPVAYSSNGPGRVVICDMPAHHGLLAALPSSVPFIVGREEAALPCALGAVLLDLLQQDAGQTLTAPVRAQAADVLRTLTGSAIMALVSEGTIGWETRRQRMAAARFIAARYTDPTLSSATVAEHLGLSRRSLQRLFEGEELTVSEHITAVRTQQAIARLKDPRMAGASMTEIATLSGFTSATAMRKAVERATGLNPSQLRVREAALLAGIASDVTSDDGPGEPDHEAIDAAVDG